MRAFLLTSTAVLSALAFTEASAQSNKDEPKQVVTPPKQQYWMDVRTASGFAAMGSSAGDVMKAMSGDVSSLATMELWLGSVDAPAKGDPKATHAVPSGATVGPNLPLETPKRGKVPIVEGEESEPPPPKGRLILFYGCGEKAKAGQPIIIDFKKLAAGQTPPGLEARVRGARSQSFKPSNWRTVGHWPNEKERNAILRAGATLAGDHAVTGNYSPPIDFKLGGANDVMAPIVFTKNEKTAAGAVSLAWNAVANATAYHAIAMGGGGDDFVFWSSSAVSTFDGGAYDFVSPREAQRLVREKVFLAPATTTCAVPQEAVKAIEEAAKSGGERDSMGGGMMFFTAYGPEFDKIDPPRPQDPKIPWNQQYHVKARFASASMQLLGQSMPGAGAMTQEERCRQAAEQPSAAEQAGRATGLPGGGMLGRALGGKKKQQDPNCPPAN